MTPERVALLVALWVRLYTRSLPAPVAQRRIEEIAADLHDQVAAERADGVGDRRIGRGVAARMLRGIPADLSWRAQMLPRRPSPAGAARRGASRPFVRVLLVTALILLLPLIAMQLSGEVAWSLADFVFAGVLLAGTGLLFEFALRRPGRLGVHVALAAIGLMAVMLGEADDAPGLVLFGGLVLAATLTRAVRAARRRG